MNEHTQRAKEKMTYHCVCLNLPTLRDVLALFLLGDKIMLFKKQLSNGLLGSQFQVTVHLCG